jgi:hypothetical protein
MMHPAAEFFLRGLWNFVRAVLLFCTFLAKPIALVFALIALKAATHGQPLLLIVCIVIGALLFAVRDWIRFSRWN